MTNRLFEPASPIAGTQLQQTRAFNDLEQHARRAAESHHLGPRPGADHNFLERLSQQEQWLQAAYHYFRQSSEIEFTLSYAAEWMLDNFYIIQQTLRQVRQDLPPGYYRRLPKLNSDSALSCFPRVYALARELILYVQVQLDMGQVEQFVKAYQTIIPLTMGEIWALPIMLRFILLESLAQATSRLTGLVTASETSHPAFQFDYALADADVIARCIPALRLLASQDWKRFFEDVSLVEEALRRDPAGIYAGMDFETRDRYRQVLEELSRATGQAELYLAHAVVAMAAAHLAGGRSQMVASTNGTAAASAAVEWPDLSLPRTAHVGFYLIDAGLAQLEVHFNYQAVGLKRLRRLVLAHPTFFYLGGVTLFSLLILAAMVYYTLITGGTPLHVAVAGLLTLIPALTIAVYLVNWLVTNTLPPRILPKLDFRNGIPAQCRTMVVIPALLTHPAEVESLLIQLELHYLRNPDPHLTFALLTDFADASQERTPDDETLIAQARQGIQTLNRRYDYRPFYLFQRRRLWNPAENKLIGLERKRGKLH
jgi:cyclic beta-1,2-glucan synthetase